MKHHDWQLRLTCDWPSLCTDGTLLPWLFFATARTLAPIVQDCNFLSRIFWLHFWIVGGSRDAYNNPLWTRRTCPQRIISTLLLCGKLNGLSVSISHLRERQMEAFSGWSWVIWIIKRHRSRIQHESAAVPRQTGRVREEEIRYWSLSHQLFYSFCVSLRSDGRVAMFEKVFSLVFLLTVEIWLLLTRMRHWAELIWSLESRDQ